MVITHSPRSIPSFLDDAALARLAPSIFAEAPASHVSARYTHARTCDVVATLRDSGWHPTSAAEHRTRLEERVGFQKHVVRFARDLGGLDSVGDTRVELVLSNSHDGTASFRMDAGLFRLVCANGLVVSDAAFEAQRLTHVQASADRFIEAAHKVASVSPEITGRVREWQSVQLSETARVELAARALVARWPEVEDRPNGLTAENLLRSRRYGDKSADLWTTFNVIQENAIRGVRYRDPKAYGLRKVRVIRNPSREIELNKQLWSVTEAFAAEVGVN